METRLAGCPACIIGTCQRKSPMETTILLLTSEPVARVVIQEVLERAGYVVMATGDLGTAVDRLQECKADLLMISPYVETITGHDAAKYLHGRCPGMRILMVAGLLADDRLQNRAIWRRWDFPQAVHRRGATE